MKKELDLMKFVLIFTVIISIYSVTNTIAGTGIEGLDISTMLINQKDHSKINATDINIELTTKRIVFKETDTIDKILISNGIYPNGESLGILYRINADIDEKVIKTNTLLTIPAIVKPRENCLVVLTLDKGIKQDFLKTLKLLDKHVEQISNVQIGQFGSITEKEQFTQSIKSITKSMDFFGEAINRQTRPLSSEMLRQMNDEAKLMNLVLNNTVNNKQGFGASDMEAVDLVLKNMNIRMQSLNEKKGPGGLHSRWPEVRVTVKTIDTNRGMEVHNLQIYYVPKALWPYRKDCEKSFDKVTSPSDRDLPEADYYIWAGKKSDPTKESILLTDRADLEVRKKTQQQNIEKDLVIK